MDWFISGAIEVTFGASLAMGANQNIMTFLEQCHSSSLSSLDSLHYLSNPDCSLSQYPYNNRQNNPHYNYTFTLGIPYTTVIHPTEKLHISPCNIISYRGQMGSKKWRIFCTLNGSSLHAKPPCSTYSTTAAIGMELLKLPQKKYARNFLKRWRNPDPVCSTQFNSPF